MKRFTAFFLSLVLLCSSLCTTAFAAAEWPDNVSISAEGGIVMDAGSGAVLYGKNIHTPYFPASITKILTALIVIENCDMDDICLLYTSGFPGGTGRFFRCPVSRRDCHESEYISNKRKSDSCKEFPGSCQPGL